MSPLNGCGFAWKAANEAALGIWLAALNGVLAGTTSGRGNALTWLAQYTSVGRLAFGGRVGE